MPRIHFNNPWRALWQTMTSDYLLAGVLLVLALVLFLAAWLPQTPAAGAASNADWQAEVQRRFGEATWFDALRPVLETIGAFNVLNGAGLRLLLALLAFCLLTRLADAVEVLWREGDWAAWVGRLRRRRLRVEADGETETEAPARDSGRPLEALGSVLAYLGGLIVLAGLATTAAGGWQTEPLPAVVGESVALGHGSDLTVRLTELAQDGRHGTAEIWRGQDSLVGSGDLAVGQPLTGGGVGIYPVGAGAGMRVQATLSNTQALQQVTGPEEEGRTEVVLTFTQDELRQLVAVPAANLVLLASVINPQDVDAQPQLQVFESGSGQIITERTVTADTVFTVGDVTFSLAPVPYVEIRAVHDPGALWTQVGVIGLLTGLGLWALGPVRRLWTRRRRGGGE